MQFRTVELCYTIQCSSGPLNFAIRFKCRSGPSKFAILLDAVQDSRTLPHVLIHLRTSELCYAFRCSLGLSNFATRSNAVQDLNLATSSKTVQDPRILLHVSMQFRKCQYEDLLPRSSCGRSCIHAFLSILNLTFCGNCITVACRFV